MGHNEDWNLVPIEGMAAGKPSIVANEGSFPEIITKNTGMIIPPTVDAICKAVRELTPDKARKMRKACEKRALLFDMGQTLRDNYEKIIEHAMIYGKGWEKTLPKDLMRP